MSPTHTLVVPRSVLAVLAEYEERLVELQRAQRGLGNRQDADAGAIYRSALARAREAGARVRAAAGA